MVKRSAGILLYRVLDSGNVDAGGVEVLIVHPGGPLWGRRDAGAWSLPKGEYLEDEEPLVAAVREFSEETGGAVDPAKAVGLGSVTQKNGKIVTAWAVEGEFDVTALVSNHFEIEWPPGSGAVRSFPEIDRALWSTPEVAREKLNPAQVAFVERLLRYVSDGVAATDDVR